MSVVAASATALSLAWTVTLRPLPFPHGERFIILYKTDVTPKVGPMAGKRMQVEEAGLYTVRDGKVVQEEFFYHMG